MCGLAAMIGPGIQRDDIKAINDLAYVTGLRGFHSTGVYQVRKDYQGNLVDEALDKKALPVSDFLYLHSLDEKANKDEGVNNKILNNTLCNLMMVHCRHATVGKINDANAHPFETERYIGMHNGSLTDHRYTSNYGEDAGKTDSERMFKDMEKHGVEQVLANLEKTSAYAVFVFDKQEKKLYVARNGLRTLFFTTNKKRGVSYFSSEQEMLRLALTRQKIEFGPIYYFEPGKIYTFDLDSVGHSYDKDNGWGARYSGKDLPPPNLKVTPSRTRFNQEDYMSTTYGGHRSRFDPSFIEKGEERTKKEKKSGKESSSTVVEFPRTHNLLGLSRKREDKFYCDECDQYLFGHEKDESARAFGPESDTVMCLDCLDKHVRPHINNKVLN